MAWSRVPGAAGYAVNVQSLANTFSTFADTAIQLAGVAADGDGRAIFAPGVVSRIVVSATDRAYYDYFRRGSDPFTGVGVTGNLVGAFGVFGSIVEIDQRALAVR
jgi:hypothetical protein